jgi:hypothetical protein
MSHHEESPAVPTSTHTLEDDARRASDVNAGRPGSRSQPEGSGDREERDIVRAKEKLDQAGGGH